MRKLFLCMLFTALSTTTMSCNARTTNPSISAHIVAGNEALSHSLDSAKQINDSIALMQDSADKLKDSLINEVGRYIKKVAPRSKMTAHNIVNQCLDSEYDISLLLSQAHLETHFGSCGSHNVFGIVGKRYKHPDHAVVDYISLMSSKYIVNRTPEELISSNFTMENNRRAKYAGNPNYGRLIGNVRNNIINNTDIHNIWCDMLDVRKKLSELGV